MEELSKTELMEIEGGDTTVWDFLNNLNPAQWFYDFGHDVVYPYVYKPIKDLFN